MIRYERAGDGSLVAVAKVRVGVGEVSIAVPLGAWEGPEPDPGGLGRCPVVVLPGPDHVELAAAGARRSGRVEPAVVEASAPGPGARLLRSASEVAIVPSGTGGALAAIRALGGWPLPALPLSDPTAVDRFLRGCQVDVDLAVPALDDQTRRRARRALLALGLDELHHVVEVDPSPALDERSLDPALKQRSGSAEGGRADLAALTAAAAGVLAGRLAAGNRRWRGDA